MLNCSRCHVYTLSSWAYAVTHGKPDGVDRAVASADLQQRYFMHQCEGDCASVGFLLRALLLVYLMFALQDLFVLTWGRCRCRCMSTRTCPRKKICIRVRMVRAKTGSQEGWLCTKHCCLPFCCIVLLSPPTIVH